MMMIQPRTLATRRAETRDLAPIRPSKFFFFFFFFFCTNRKDQSIFESARSIDRTTTTPMIPRGGGEPPAGSCHRNENTILTTSRRLDSFQPTVVCVRRGRPNGRPRTRCGSRWKRRGLRRWCARQTPMNAIRCSRCGRAERVEDVRSLLGVIPCGSLTHRLSRLFRTIAPMVGRRAGPANPGLEATLSLQAASVNCASPECEFKFVAQPAVRPWCRRSDRRHCDHRHCDDRRHVAVRAAGGLPRSQPAP